MTDLNNIVVIGNYLPRMCGIATFTTDLVSALSENAENTRAWAIAINDTTDGYQYPKEVRFEINQDIMGEYRRASEYLNINLVDAVCLQHEYGIYGGSDGRYILQLLRKLRMPVVSTLHTVLKDPSPAQKQILCDIIDLSDRVIVMAHRAEEFLRDIYNAPAEKITFIHHGIPDMPFVDPSFYKDQFGVEGRKVILTFGLLSPNKGIEYMIRALPAIVKKHPDAVYVVLGATHPHIKKTQGEEYRLGLQRLARSLDVDEYIMFHDRFVERSELCEFLGAADVYVTPYLTESQIVSGTLAYAMGVGKATVSTPYWYAQEMMEEKRGILVPFKSPDSLADAVIALLDNDVERNTMRKRAYTFSRNAIWSQVARDYMSVFYEVKAERFKNPKQAFGVMTLEQEKTSLPELKLDHLSTLTDDTGMLQHAKYSIPDLSHGYCVDDNARALIVAVTAQNVLGDVPLLVNLQKKYLSFLMSAFNEANGSFRNFMNYERRWMEQQGSEDCQGRALWGLGVCCAFSTVPGCVGVSTTLFHRGLNAADRISHPRSLAYTLVGIHAYLTRFSGDSEVRRFRELLAQRLLDRVRENTQADWPWFEPQVTYANAKIPQALLLSGQWMNRPDMTELGFRLLNWLIDVQTVDNHYSPIGNNGWFTRDKGKARFDQQPIEAHSMLETCLLAYRMTQNDFYAAAARRAFDWFLGQNDLNQPLYDYTTGGCRDGLQPDGPNYNEGAESTIAWLLSLIAMHGFEADQKKLQYVE